MSGLSGFVVFWWECFLIGISAAYSLFGHVGGIAGIIWALIKIHPWKKLPSRQDNYQKNWEDFVLKLSGWVAVISFFVGTIIIGPFLKFQEAQQVEVKTLQLNNALSKRNEKLFSINQTNASLIVAQQIEISRLNQIQSSIDPSLAAFKKRSEPFIKDLLEFASKSNAIYEDDLSSFKLSFEERDRRYREATAKFMSEYRLRFHLRAVAIRDRLAEFGVSSERLDMYLGGPIPVLIEPIAMELSRLLEQAK